MKGLMFLTIGLVRGLLNEIARGDLEGITVGVLSIGVVTGIAWLVIRKINAAEEVVDPGIKCSPTAFVPWSILSGEGKKTDTYFDTRTTIMFVDKGMDKCPNLNCMGKIEYGIERCPHCEVGLKWFDEPSPKGWA
jgi:hypothetical protein